MYAIFKEETLPNGNEVWSYDERSEYDIAVNAMFSDVAEKLYSISRMTDHAVSPIISLAKGCVSLRVDNKDVCETTIWKVVAKG